MRKGKKRIEDLSTKEFIVVLLKIIWESEMILDVTLKLYKIIKIIITSIL